MSIKRAMFWAGFWISLALIFNLGVYFVYDKEHALNFFGGYVMELSMSIDNLFVFLMIFTSFELNEHCQRRALNYGIFGAIFLRLFFILLGASIVTRFEWALYIMGAFLIYSGLKVFKKEDEEGEKNYNESKLFKTVGRVIPMTDTFVEDKFFIKKDKILYATPLLAVVVLIEFSDILFAVDSVPAILAITTDTLIVYTSNIFAILGLRNFYFLLEKVNKACRFVKYGVGIILFFVGTKLSILAVPYIFEKFGKELHYSFKIPTAISISAIFLVLLLSIIASLVIKEKKADEEYTESECVPQDVQIDQSVNE